MIRELIKDMAKYILAVILNVSEWANQMRSKFKASLQFIHPKGWKDNFELQLSGRIYK